MTLALRLITLGIFLFSVRSAVAASLADWQENQLTRQSLWQRSASIPAAWERRGDPTKQSEEILFRSRQPETVRMQAARMLLAGPFLLFQGQGSQDLVAAFYRLFREKNMRSGTTYSVQDEEENKFEFEVYPTLNPERLIVTRYEPERDFYAERFIKLGASGTFGSEGDIYEGPDGKRYEGNGNADNITAEQARLFEVCLKAVLDHADQAQPE